MNPLPAPFSSEQDALAMLTPMNASHSLRGNSNILSSAGGDTGERGTSILNPQPDGNKDLAMSSQAIVLGFLLVIVFIASVVANAFVLVVFCKRKSLSLSNRFVANLTVCNCLNAFLVLPFALASLYAQRWLFGQTWCICTGFFMNVLVTASILTLAVISIDRYFAVVTPLHYSMRLTPRRCSILIVAIWTGAVVISAPPLLGWNSIGFQLDKMVCTVHWSSGQGMDAYYTFFLVSCSFLVPLMAMLWTYARIFRAARGNSVRARRNSVIRGSSNGNNSSTVASNGNKNSNANNSPGSNSNNSNGKITNANPSSPSISSSDVEPSIKNSLSGSIASTGSQQLQTPVNGRRRSSTVPIIRRLSQSSSRSSSLLWRMEEWKTAVTSFLVLSSFAVCWAPYFVVLSVEAALGASAKNSLVSSDTSTPSTSSSYPKDWPLISSISIVLAMASCAVNPLVYVFRSKVFRNDLSLIVKRRGLWLFRGGAREVICVPHEISGVGSIGGIGGLHPSSRRTSVVRNESGKSLRSMGDLEEGEEGDYEEKEALRGISSEVKGSLERRFRVPGQGRTRRGPASVHQSVASNSKKVRYGEEYETADERRLSLSETATTLIPHSGSSVARE
ncbi:5-hydroxytryptamine receptor 1a [Plakobranchus ocellatus]|uniref:5-hydroxytryptamine receptor 1a n=1 Tax=Plakobranchus ocellatus TaxID=259542 RepID=A0AAV4B8M7_9GAST|nr:5-hydroxytryptamine receptor 1a [Plakobranchus ocellatus]